MRLLGGKNIFRISSYPKMGGKCGTKTDFGFLRSEMSSPHFYLYFKPHSITRSHLRCAYEIKNVSQIPSSPKLGENVEQRRCWNSAQRNEFAPVLPPFQTAFDNAESSQMFQRNKNSFSKFSVSKIGRKMWNGTGFGTLISERSFPHCPSISNHIP